jgi:hypothetical protein
LSGASRLAPRLLRSRPVLAKRPLQSLKLPGLHVKLSTLAEKVSVYSAATFHCSVSVKSARRAMRPPFASSSFRRSLVTTLLT